MSISGVSQRPASLGTYQFQNINHRSQSGNPWECVSCPWSRFPTAQGKLRTAVHRVRMLNEAIEVAHCRTCTIGSFHTFLRVVNRGKL